MALAIFVNVRSIDTLTSEIPKDAHFTVVQENDGLNIIDDHIGMVINDIVGIDRVNDFSIIAHIFLTEKIQ